MGNVKVLVGKGSSVYGLSSCINSRVVSHRIALDSISLDLSTTLEKTHSLVYCQLTCSVAICKIAGLLS